MGNPWDQNPKRRPRSIPGGALWLGLIVGVAVLVGFLMWRFPGALHSDRDWSYLVYLLLLLAALSVSYTAGRRLRLGKLAKAAGLWLVIVAVVAVVLVFRHDLAAVGERLLGELLPYRGTTVGDSEIRFPVGSDGHFRIEAQIDGQAVRFLVDTGATSIVLSPADARRIGFDPQALAFTGFAETANGTVRTAAVRLDSLEIGPIRMRDLPASVNAAEMRSSLLGMRFFERLRSFEVRDGTLILRQ